MESVCVNDPTICAIQRWRVGCDAQVTSSSVLCLVTRSDGSTARVIAPVSGRVVRIAKQNGDLVNMGDTLVELATSCRHDVVMKDICALCGANLREQLGCPGQRVVASLAKVAMVHSIPELHVSEERALRLAVADESRLLRNRRLSLLVDLDQTLIHTTMGSVPVNLADVTRFQLSDPSNFNCNSIYTTKLRPGVKQFLDNMAKIFEMHIVTFGNRLYAHRIAEILDTDKCYFSHRILSRDEAFNPTTKTGNLQALFPRGDQMVCIIDDREEVWESAPNLVHVKQYSYFAGTEDINNPYQLQPDKKSSYVDPMDEAAVAAKQRAASFEAVERCMVENNIVECTAAENVETEVEENAKEEIHAVKSQTQELLKWPDHDVYLDRLEAILTDIHREFFARLDMSSESSNSTSDQHKLPSLRDVVPFLRQQVLKGCVIVFSGVFPMHMPLERSKAYQIAVSLGAVVQNNLVLTEEENKKSCSRRRENKMRKRRESNPKRKKRIKFEDENLKITQSTSSSSSFSSDDKECEEKSRALSESHVEHKIILTTHLVSARTNTSKWHAARRAGLAVVSPDWLWACHYHWQRIPESDYELSVDGSTVADETKMNATLQQQQQSEELRKIKQREERQYAKMKHEAKRTAREEERQLAAALPPPARFDLADHPLLRMSRDDLEDMEDEVNAAQGSDSDCSSSSNSCSSKDDKYEKKLRLAVLSNSPSLSGVDPDDALGEQVPVECAVNDESYPEGWAPRRRQRDDDVDDALLKDCERDWGEGFAHEGYDYDDAERRFRALSESSNSSTSDSSGNPKLDDVGDDTLDALRDFM